jgi:hypothetical protein
MELFGASIVYIGRGERMKNLLLCVMLLGMLCIPSGNRPLTATASPQITYTTSPDFYITEQESPLSVDEKMLLQPAADCDPGIFIDIPQNIDDIVVP